MLFFMHWNRDGSVFTLYIDVMDSRSVIPGAYNGWINPGCALSENSQLRDVLSRLTWQHPGCTNPVYQSSALIGSLRPVTDYSKRLTSRPGVLRSTFLPSTLHKAGYIRKIGIHSQWCWYLLVVFAYKALFVIYNLTVYKPGVPYGVSQGLIANLNQGYVIQGFLPSNPSWSFICLQNPRHPSTLRIISEPQPKFS